MVPPREIHRRHCGRQPVNDGTAAVNQRTTSYCEPVVESTVRSIRSVNTKDVSDGKATPTEDIKVTGKAGDLALGTEAGNELCKTLAYRHNKTNPNPNPNPNPPNPNPNT